MRNYITSTLPLIAYAKAEEGNGQAPAETSKVEEDPFAGFEVSEEIIGRDYEDKYGWDKFPAPAPKLDAEGKPTGAIRYAGRRYPLDGVKADSIRGSFKKYQDRVVTKGGPKPVFRSTIEKDDNEVPVAIFVQRIK